MSGARFLEARPADDRPAAVLIQGAPYEGGVSYRGGAARAPDAIRIASDSIESWSLRLRRDLCDVDLADAGDLALAGLDAGKAMDEIARATAGRARDGAAVVTLGGDHSISIGTSRGLHAAHEGLVHLVYDAHCDLRASYGGSDLSHACGTRHMASARPTFLLGVRSGAREEFDDATRLLAGWSEGLAPPPTMRGALEGAPVHLSIDLDVLDPSILPGTGNPEPGGPTYRDLREALLGLAGLRIVAMDVCEVSPPLDPTGVSEVVAAELVRECVLGLLTGSMNVR